MPPLLPTCSYAYVHCSFCTASLIDNFANSRLSKAKQSGKCPICSTFVTSLHIVTATCCSTLIGCLKRVTLFVRYGCKRSHSLSKVVRDILFFKFSFHHSSPNIPFFTAVHHSLLAGLHQTILICLVMTWHANSAILLNMQQTIVNSSNLPFMQNLNRYTHISNISHLHFLISQTCLCNVPSRSLSSKFPLF